MNKRGPEVEETLQDEEQAAFDAARQITAAHRRRYCLHLAMALAGQTLATAKMTSRRLAEVGDAADVVFREMIKLLPADPDVCSGAGLILLGVRFLFEAGEQGDRLIYGIHPGDGDEEERHGEKKP